MSCVKALTVLKRPLLTLVIALSLLVAGLDLLFADTYQCSSSEDVHKALAVV